MEQENLLRKIFNWGKLNIFSRRFDVVHQFQKRPVMLHIPNQVRQKDYKRGQPADPEPFTQECFALFAQKETDNYCEAKHGYRILFLQPESSHYAKTNPIAGVALDGQNRKIHAAHPEQRLQAVCGQKASTGEINGSNEHRYGTEHEGKASAIKLTRDQRRQNDQCRRRQGRQKPYAAKGVSKDNATNSNQERQKWGLV